MSSSGRPTSVAAGDLQVAPATLPPRPPSSSSSSALVDYTPPAANPEDEDLEVKLRRIIECVPVRVSNTSGSSAGSGSGDFHQVRNIDGEDDDEPDQGKSKKQKLFRTEEGEKLQLEIAISASDIKDKYKDATLLPKWKAFQTVIFLERDDGLHDSSKIAAFDFDGCLANTSVRRVGADAWSLMYPSIPEKLQNLYRDGYKLIIFTNESNIERWTKKRQSAVDSKIGRLESFIKLVKVPIQVFIACGLSRCQLEDLFRKPTPGMWKIMEKEFNSGVSIDMDQSFYVGDAAGRPDDHSDADIKFAQAVGLKFYVPEEYFCSD